MDRFSENPPSVKRPLEIEWPFYCNDFLRSYWHPANASVDTGNGAPGAGVTAFDFSSFGEQSSIPPDDGTNAIPSTTYEAGSGLCVNVVPPAVNAPTNGVPAERPRL